MDSDLEKLKKENKYILFFPKEQDMTPRQKAVRDGINDGYKCGICGNKLHFFEVAGLANMQIFDFEIKDMIHLTNIPLCSKCIDIVLKNMGVTQFTQK